MSIVDVVLHWSRNFANEVESEEVAKDQATCFFRLCEGAELGARILGRRGSPTRLELQTNVLTEFITGEKHQDSKVPDAIIEPKIVESKSDIPVVTVQPNEVRPKAEKEPLVSEFYKRVYISHGKNRSFVDPIRRLLAFGQLEAVVSVQEPSISKAIPDKVMDEMRSCGAAIIHVDTEEVLTDKAGKERIILNENVLIEIGAAMALYGRRFVLLVREGVNLPSNLQGLYEVRYPGEVLDSDTTIRLMETIKRLDEERIPE